MLFVDNCIEKLDQSSCIVQVGGVKLRGDVLLDLQKFHLCVINAINVGFRSSQFCLVQLLSSLFVCWVFEIGSELLQMVLLLGSITLFSNVEFGIFRADFLFYNTGVADSNVVIGASWDLLAQIL